jgi:sugar/nucleoside kinase (ribokinase family)
MNEHIQVCDEPVAIVGNINLDVRTTAIHSGSGVLADGETSIEEIYETLGGGGANTAVAAAALGGRVYLVGCLGNDNLGGRLIAALRQFGVTPMVAQKAVPTGRSLALTWDNHHRHFISSLPNAAELRLQDVPVAELARLGCRHLYRADIWFSPAMLFGGNLELLRQARAAGMTTSLDINWDPLWSSPAGLAAVSHRIAAVAKLLPHVTFVHGNERELSFFTGRPELNDSIAALLDAGAETVIVHRGPNGSAAASRDAWIEAPACQVARVVSETGTGDVFTAAFLLLGKTDLPERLRQCNRIAAQHLAASPSYIRRLE